MANDETVHRRRFVGSALAGAAGIATGACGGPADLGGDGAGEDGQPRVLWRLASSFPRSLDTIYGAADTLADRVAALTGGRFQIRSYPANELIPALQVMDAVQQGTVQVSHTASYYFTGKNPVLAFDACVPFGFTSRIQDAWLHQGGGRELIDEMYADFGIVSFPGGNTGTQMGGWFKREINSAADLRGLKMRIPGLGGEVMDRLGVTVQVLPGGDIYPALERGAIDATEWVGPYDDEKLGFHTAARYYYYPGWWEPGPALTFQVNRAAWDRLPAAYQDAFRAASIQASVGMQTKYDAVNPAALGRLIEGGVEMRRFSSDIMQAARDAAFDIMEQNAAADASYRKVFDAWTQFREDSFRWFSTAEQAYADFVFNSDQSSA